jgi:ubiquitin-like 1-activating enzyme E1 B
MFIFSAMAGNIIPAIATTNAITAGFVVMHALKILQNKYEKCQSVYMRLRPNARNQLMVPDKSKYITPFGIYQPYWVGNFL